MEDLSFSDRVFDVIRSSLAIHYVKDFEPLIMNIFQGIKRKKCISKEFFDGVKIAIDAEVKVLYQESEKDIIGQYIIFSKVYNEQRKLYGNTKQAITEMY